MGRELVFLDRDGTVNVDHGFVHRIEDWEFVNGAVEALKLLRAGGFSLAIVTNQSGVTRGYYTADDVVALHEHMRRVLFELGVQIDAIAFCPHGVSDNCACRKPGTLMSEEIERQLGESIRYSASWMVGDKTADVEFGMRLGTRTALLASRYWSNGECVRQPDIIADSLLDAARMIVDK